MSALLQVEGLGKRFGGVIAVDDVRFSVQPGETLAIMGPNGSGKTTTFNLIAGALFPDAGRVVLDGRDVGALPPHLRAELGIARTFQSGRVFGNMTLLENVMVAERVHMAGARPLARLRRRRLLNWLALLAETALAIAGPPGSLRDLETARSNARSELERFGERLWPRLQERAYTQSYANRRRTEIARALALSPRLLLLDEPAAGMNPSETRELGEQLAELRDAGLTILLVEHKFELVVPLAHRALVLDEGRIIYDGSPDGAQRDDRVRAAYIGKKRVAPPQRVGAATPARTILELRDVVVRYGGFTALHGLSLQVGAGEIVSLLGGNASGKSTTIKAVLGLLSPASGTISLDGKDATRWSTAARVRGGLACVPEGRRVFPEMTVEENLLLGAFVRSDGKAVAQDLDRAYAFFPRLYDRRRQAAGSLSGGEQQMLAIARALMSRPRLICMDEPTMGLSPALVERVLEHVVEINRSGTAMLIVEQNAAAALSIAHRGYVLSAGAVVASGEARALLDDPNLRTAYLGGP